MCTVAKSKKKFGWLIKIIQLPFFFFFFFTPLSLIQSHLSSSLSQLRSHSQLWSPIHVARLKLNLLTPVSLSQLWHWPTKLVADRSAWLGNPWSSPLIGVLACGYWLYHTTNWRFGFFNFLFLLLWTGGGGVVDGGCGCGCEENDWRFGSFFFSLLAKDY